MQILFTKSKGMSTDGLARSELTAELCIRSLQNTHHKVVHEFLGRNVQPRDPSAEEDPPCYVRLPNFWAESSVESRID